MYFSLRKVDTGSDIYMHEYFQKKRKQSHRLHHLLPNVTVACDLSSNQ